MHTTNLPENWIAVHNGGPLDCQDKVIFRKIDNSGIDFEVPYCVVRDFVANQVRCRKIEELEHADAETVLHYMK